jgi:nucleoside-diphosphate-sugar epimerase
MTKGATMDKDQLVLVVGADGFIGGHLVADFLRQGHRRICTFDIKPFDAWYQHFSEVYNWRLDLRERSACDEAPASAAWIYNLGADMGGAGFIEANKELCMLSVLINTHLLMAARDGRAERSFLSSSACVYAAEKQTDTPVTALREADAYPAMPEDGYGWEKLFSERMYRHFTGDFGLATRVSRYHNVYGPLGTWDGGREKAPAAFCRKVIYAKLSGRHEIEIWDDGEETRRFMYIDDCLLGTDRLETINRLVDIIEAIAGVTLGRRYKLDAPLGVHGRNSDNTLIKELFGWTPGITLEDRLEKTYAWIFDQMTAPGPRRAFA